MKRVPGTRRKPRRIRLGFACSNRCKLPIAPTDLFPRKLSQIAKPS